MKKNRKLLLMTSLMLGVTAIATSTATYAWFTMNKNAFVNIDEVKATTDGDLEIIAYTTGNMPTTDYESDSIVSQTGDSLTDVSGDGVSFYKPTFSDTTNSTAVGVRTISYANKTGFYSEYSVVLRHKKQGLVYMGADSAVTAGAQGLELFKAARVGIFDRGTKDNSALAASDMKVVFAAGTSADTRGKHLTGATFPTLDVGYFNSASAVAGEKYYQGFANRDATAAGYAIAANPTTKYSPVIATLAANATGETGYYYAVVTIRVWIEGEDAACIDANKPGSFDVNIHFYCILNEEAGI